MGFALFCERTEPRSGRRSERPTARKLAAELSRRARRSAKGRAIKLLARLVRDASDADIERRFGRALTQRAMFTAMAAGFVSDAAAGFQGEIVYELQRPATEQPPAYWTIEVFAGKAVARSGAARSPALTLRLRVADFVRIAAGTIDPAEPLLKNRASFEGDFALAARLPEMFGAPSPY